ncbi:HPF/RaiA family ribosome-associated protein [Chloroflexota bacterium]
MQIQINTDHNIKGNEALTAQVSGVVEGALSEFSVYITRVEVHLSDVNSNKRSGNDDMRCMIETRLHGRQSVAVRHRAATVEQAVHGAAHKLARLIESALGRSQDKGGHRTVPSLSDTKSTEES